MTRGTIETVWAGTMSLAAPVLRVLLRVRAGRGKEIATRLSERRGIDPTPRPPGRLLWLHAASVGETVSILPVLSALSAVAPGVTTLLTTGTVTSAALLDQRLPAMGLASRVLHRFAPLDVPSWAACFLDHWRPDAAAFVESELWPNILSACRDREIPAMLINARMSARSHAAWSRAPAAARSVLARFAKIHARGEEDAARLRSLGAVRVEVLGDLKLSAAPLPADPRQLASLATRLAGRKIFLAASTHPGEEVLIQAVHESLASSHPGLLTIVVPRHPERGGQLSAQLRAPRRRLGEPPPDSGIWLADTLGELGLWYRLCDVAFVGHSLIAPGGGQNPLEPARLGCPVLIGPHTANFREHVALLRAAGGLAVAEDLPTLTRLTGTLFADPDARIRMGARAKAAVETSESLPGDTAQALLALIPGV